MDISTTSWFNYLHDEILTEGLRDIGLPEFVIDYLEDAMPDASEKARMYVANNWKKARGGMSGAFTPNNIKWEMAKFLIDDMFKNYVITNNSYERGGPDLVGSKTRGGRARDGSEGLAGGLSRGRVGSMRRSGGKSPGSLRKSRCPGQ